MIDLIRINTSGNNALCGYYSMANYIMTLPFNLRKKFYIDLLTNLYGPDYSSLSDPIFYILEDFLFTVSRDRTFEIIKNKYLNSSDQFNSTKFTELFKINPNTYTIDFQHYVGGLLSYFGKKIVESSQNQLLENGTQKIDRSAKAAFRESGAESFITAENLKKTFKYFFPNQDMAMSQEILNIDLKPQTIPDRTQTVTTDSPTHSNPRLQSITNIVDAKCQELVPVKSDSLDDFFSKTADEQDEILFYLLLKNILNPLKIKDQIFNCPLTYDRYNKYFGPKGDEELLRNLLRELIDFSSLSGEQERTKITQILSDNLVFNLKAQAFVNNILENLKKQFSLYSFRFKFLSSNPFCVSNDHSSHYTTMIDSQRSQEPLSNVSLQYDLSLPTQSKEQNEISQMMIDDLFKKSKQFCAEFLGDANDQRASDLELIKIYRSTEIFPRHNGRNDDIIRCKKSVREVERLIENTLEGLKIKYKMSDEELVLAIAIAKTFGGIGSALRKIQNKIEEIDPQTQDQTEQNQVENNFFQLCRSIFTPIKLKKFCQFSAEFQKECQKQGIYSGRQELTDQKARSYGCRLTFVPDEVFAFRFNALPYSSKTRQIIDQYIASHQRPKAVEVGPDISLRDVKTGGVLRSAGTGGLLDRFRQFMGR